MEKLLLMVALACGPGERFLDLKGQFASNLQYVDLVISVRPFYSRIYIYPLGFPDGFQPCCGNKPTSVLRLAVGAGQFCVRQSQPQMEWHIRALLRPDVEI